MEEKSSREHVGRLAPRPHVFNQPAFLTMKITDQKNTSFSAKVAVSAKRACVICLVEIYFCLFFRAAVLRGADASAQTSRTASPPPSTSV